eukprot:scaffold33961_cov112-Isochrysis_galbana.AAC.1
MSGFWGLVVKPGSKPTPLRNQPGEMVMVLKQVWAALVAATCSTPIPLLRQLRVCITETPPPCAGGPRPDFQGCCGNKRTVYLDVHNATLPHACCCRQPLIVPHWPCQCRWVPISTSDLSCVISHRASPSSGRLTLASAPTKRCADTNVARLFCSSSYGFRGAPGCQAGDAPTWRRIILRPDARIPYAQVHFHLTGKCAVHLTGFYEMDDDDDDDDDEGMEEAMARNEGEGMYDEDDDDDDEDDEGEDGEEGEEGEEGDDEIDSDELEEDDDDDDEDEDEDGPRIVELGANGQPVNGAAHDEDEDDDDDDDEDDDDDDDDDDDEEGEFTAEELARKREELFSGLDPSDLASDDDDDDMGEDDDGEEGEEDGEEDDDEDDDDDDDDDEEEEE